MVNVYIILAGVFSVFLESSLVGWPWFLLYSFVLLRRQADNYWLYWLLVLAVLVDVMSFRTVGFSALMVVCLITIKKILFGNQAAFWYLEPIAVVGLLSVWCYMNSLPVWFAGAFAIFFGVIGFVVRKKENFVSLR